MLHLFEEWNAKNPGCGHGHFGLVIYTVPPKWHCPCWRSRFAFERVTFSPSKQGPESRGGWNSTGRKLHSNKRQTKENNQNKPSKLIKQNKPNKTNQINKSLKSFSKTHSSFIPPRKKNSASGACTFSSLGWANDGWCHDAIGGTIFWSGQPDHYSRGSWKSVIQQPAPEIKIFCSFCEDHPFMFMVLWREGQQKCFWLVHACVACLSWIMTRLLYDSRLLSFRMFLVIVFPW